MSTEAAGHIEDLLTEFQAGERSHEMNIRALRLALEAPHLVELICGLTSFITNVPLVVKWHADPAAVAWLRECYGQALPLILAASSQDTPPASDLFSASSQAATPARSSLMVPS